MRTVRASAGGSLSMAAPPASEFSFPNTACERIGPVSTPVFAAWQARLAVGHDLARPMVDHPARGRSHLIYARRPVTPRDRSKRVNDTTRVRTRRLPIGLVHC